MRKWVVRYDSYGKFQPSGVSGKVEPVTSPEMPEGWNFPSAITHVPAIFARSFLIFVPSPSHSLVVLSRSITLTLLPSKSVRIFASTTLQIVLLQ